MYNNRNLAEAEMKKRDMVVGFRLPNMYCH